MTTHLDFFTERASALADRRRDFLELGRRAGHFPHALVHREDDPRPMDVSIWCSNDYLGMGQHPEVIAAMKEATDQFGAGSGGSRNIGGTNPYHVQLERELASLHGKEAALLFTSGYTANDGSLSVLAGFPQDCLVLSDELNHASIIDGIRHSGAAKQIFRHNDADHLARLLAAADPEQPKMVVLESVYSMSGDVAPVERIVQVSAAHGASVFLDEVHAVGMYGPQGAGIAARDGVDDAITVIMGTLGKGFGAMGGYIAGPAVLVDAVRTLSRPFVFTTSVPPAIAAGALAAVRHLRSCDQERASLRDNAALMHGLLRSREIPVLSEASHIVSVLVGDDHRCRAASMLLLERHGMYVQSINAPSVRTGQEILRVAPGAVHLPAEIEKFADALDGVWSELGLPRGRTPA